jgi:hypothetical protein
MAGRAGRRGLDTVGTVIIMAPEDKVPFVVVVVRIITNKNWNERGIILFIHERVDTVGTVSYGR